MCSRMPEGINGWEDDELLVVSRMYLKGINTCGARSRSRLGLYQRERIVWQPRKHQGATPTDSPWPK